MSIICPKKFINYIHNFNDKNATSLYVRTMVN